MGGSRDDDEAERSPPPSSSSNAPVFSSNETGIVVSDDVEWERKAPGAAVAAPARQQMLKRRIECALKLVFLSLFLFL